jgi:HEAT repeat protein
VSEERLRALASTDARVRLAALEELAAEGAPLAAPLALAAVECLGSGSKALQRRATDVLRHTDEAVRPAVLAALRAGLAAPDPNRRWGTAYALGRLDVLEPALVSPLLEALGGRDGDRRWAAAEIMVGCGTRHPEVVVPALREALHAPVPELRKMALYVLRDLGIDLPGFADELLAATRDDEPPVRLAALAVLVRLERPPPAACGAALRLATEDPNPGVRRAAVSALGVLGRGVPAAEAALDAALASDDVSMRRAAEGARRLYRRG